DGNPTARYLFADNGTTPLAKLGAGADSGQPYWYLADRVGNVRQVTDGAGNLRWKYSYDQVSVATASSPNGQAGQADRWRAAGEEWEKVGRNDNEGLYYQGAGRHVSPVTGHSLGGDPRLLASGDYDPGRNSGYNPTKVGPGGAGDALN